ncbi:putative Spindle pole protein [Giardia duodenalis]|uniref:Spindle pole protein n=1 Tax=Giardia intestinalis (strain ATCC 50803 / WB clone C6) TaxID=184922 RepID=A8BDJ6_GIAIC|nr:putative Spindle pole protein [Giardia intestinalis]KAE8304251.1 putative Spindle pole protein [Giardia intestinalis]|eukprot:XP_001707804.1 Spindle pole protein, putative [Giardia lamblia ATCC 50803]
MHDAVEGPASPESSVGRPATEHTGDLIGISSVESPLVLCEDSTAESKPRREDQKSRDAPMEQSNISNTTATTLHGTQLLQSKQADNAFLTDFVLDTKLFSSGLDEATLTGSLYSMIDPASRREISNLILSTKKIVYKSASVVFKKLKTNIEERKLFVMFEDILDCNSKYDHLNPKSTLPIFLPFLDEAESSIYSLVLPQLYHEIEVAVARTLESDMLRKQTMLDELDDLRRLVDQLKNQLAEFELGVSQSATLNAIDRKVLIQRIITLKEQLHWRGRLAPDSTNVQYKPDYMDIKQSKRGAWSEEFDEGLDEDEEDTGTEKQLLSLKQRRLLRELEDDVKLLERKIEEKRQLIAQLNAKNEFMEAEIKRLTGVLDATDDRHRQLRMLKKESDELDRLLAEMHANYDAKMKEMENLQKRYTKGIDEAEQRTVALANKLKSSYNSEKLQNSGSGDAKISKKDSAETEKLKNQVDKLLKALAAKEKEIEQLKLGSMSETKTEASQTAPWSPQYIPKDRREDSPSARLHQDTEAELKARSENAHLTTQIKEQASEIDRLRKQLEQAASRLSEAESALQKERASEKVPLDDSILAQTGSSIHKGPAKTTTTKSIGCGPDTTLSKESSKLTTGASNEYKELSPEEEELLRSIDPAMAFSRTLVAKARGVLQAAIDLNKHRVASLNGPTSAVVLSAKEKIDTLRQSVVSLLEEKELEGLLDAHREEVVDLATIQKAAKAAKAALHNYRDVSIGVHNGADDDRRGSIGDDLEADGYNPHVNRASYAADSILRTRKNTSGFQIHYNSRTMGLDRPDDVFSRLYNLAETTRKKLGEKRKAYLAKLSEREAHRMRYKMQATDTIASAVDTAMGLIGKSMANTADLAELQLVVKNTFTELLGAVLKGADSPSTSATATMDRLRQEVAACLISLQDATAVETSPPHLQCTPAETVADTTAISQPLLKVTSSSIPGDSSLQTQPHILQRSASLPINPVEGLTVQSLSLDDPHPFKDLLCSTDHLPAHIIKNPATSYIIPCDLRPSVTSLELQIPPDDLCASSTLRSFPSRSNQQRPTNVSGRLYLFDSFGDVVGFISSAGNITFYGEYAQYSTHNRVISDVSDTTCSLLSSRGSSKNSSRVTSRAGSAKQQTDTHYTYMLQKVSIYDPAITPRSGHSVVVQTDLSLLSGHQPRVDYFTDDNPNSYRHRMVHNYKDMPLGNVFSTEPLHQLPSLTPTNTAPSFSADSTCLSARQTAPHSIDSCSIVDGARDITAEDSAFTEPRPGMKRSSSCILFGGVHRAQMSPWATIEGGALSDKGPSNEISGLEPPCLQRIALFSEKREEDIYLAERRAKSVGGRTRKGFHAIDIKTGKLDVSAEEAAELEEQLTRMANTSLLNPDKIGSTIQKPTLLIYDTDTAPVRYRKAVEYMSGIGGDPKDINIMAVVMESGAMLRNPDIINSLNSQIESTPAPTLDAKSSSAVAHDTLAPRVDAANGDHVCVSPELSILEAPQIPYICPDSDAVSECSVCEEINDSRQNLPNQSELHESKLGASLSNETAHRRLLSSLTDLIKKRDDAFLVKSYDNSQAYDSAKRTSSDTQPLLTVKVVSTSLEKLPSIASNNRAGSVTSFKAVTICRNRSKSVSDEPASLSPRMKVEDLDAIPSIESKCYLNDVTEKSLLRASAARGSIPSLSALRDSRGNPLIFNDRMVDDSGHLHSINLHKDGWEHMRGSFSSSVMKQQAVNKLKTLATCSAQLRINPTSTKPADTPLLVSSTVTPGVQSVRSLPKSVIARGASANASRRLAQPPESLQPKTPLKPL